VDNQDPRVRLEQAQEDLHEWQALWDHSGWKKWVRLLEEQQVILIGTILQPIQSMDAVLEQQYNMGQLSRSRLDSSMLVTIINELKEEIREILEAYPQLRGDDNGPSTTQSRNAP